MSVLLVAVGLYLTNDFNRDQLRLQRDSTSEQQALALKGQRADRFIAAIGQLGQEGADKLGIRLGGIYALEALMKDSPEDTSTVIEVLCAFVRTHAPRPKRWAPISPRDPMRLQQLPDSPADIRAAISVLARRPDPQNHANLDLSNSLLGLHRADLPGANLAGTDLSGVDLGAADLRAADLSGARMLGGFMSGAYMPNANLRKADLGAADLRGATMDGVDLSRTNLTSANLSSANLRGADLRGAKLSGLHPSVPDLSSADLSGANLHGTILDGANLDDANLTNADLGGADLRGSNLSGADLRGADLRGAKLAPGQLACLHVDASTNLSANETRPAEDVWMSPGCR